MIRRLATGLAAAFVLLLGLAGPATAQDLTEYWDVTIDVRADGTFRVTEVIGQRFNQQRRGIFRYIPVTEQLADGGLVEVPDGTADDWFQRIRITDIEVSSPTAPDATKVEKPLRIENNGVLSIRVGEEDTFITGLHEYRIAYTVEGAMLDAGDGTSLLRWDVIGDGWVQPVLTASIVVQAPGGIQPGTICAGGGFVPGGECQQVSQSATQYVARAEGIGNFTPLSIQVAFDDASVRPSDPILQRKWNFTGALWGDARVWPLAILAGLLSLGGVGRLLYREGRDRETRGDVTVDGRTDTTHSQGVGERTRPLFQPRAIGVEFRPPGDLTPGELGLVLDERVDPVDVSATIVHLAVRGYLVIEEEQNKTLWWTRTDWTLRRTDKDASDLLSFERHLYDGLFDGREEVAVSDLKGTFHTDYGKAERALYEQGRKRGWFNARPDKTRSKWIGIGVAALTVSFVLFVVAMIFSRVAVATLPLLLASIVMLAGASRMPRRTPKGSQLLTRTLGFREFIETAETDRAQFAERENLFVEYLPYAVVFGATEKWARAFEGLAVLTAGATGAYAGWYVGSHHGGAFDAREFSAGLSDFSSTVGSAASTAPPSSSGGGGGFSGGGGFGGGGGGSW